jgi:hypothetical protein
MKPERLLAALAAVPILAMSFAAPASAQATSGLVIAAAPTDAVVIKGLDVEGLGTTGASSGITVQSAASVVIDHCVIGGFRSADGVDGNGVFVNNASPTSVKIQHSLIAHNANGGVWIKPTGGANAIVAINDSQIASNGFGVVADGTSTTGSVNGTVQGTMISASSQNGVMASATTAASDILVLDQVTAIVSGKDGLAASGATAELLVGNSTIYGNIAGVVATNSGSIVSYGNNQLNGNNHADGAFTATVAPQ